ncbi:MAG: hypothetical protein LBV43_14800 [Prevotella sp.]|jgi:hypothetical protein|nr:hypothetical protein [Prevotella sp.]
MKKILLTALGAMFLLFSSCSQEDMSETVQPDLGQAISQLSDNYEAQLKGYVIVNKEKDESTPSQQEETSASPEFMTMLKDSLERTFSKTSVKQTKMGPGADGHVGVFKYSTCGSYPEFQYHQDNEDGGWTSIHGDHGATYVDGNGNMKWRFCLVPGHHPRDYGPIHDDYRKIMPYWYGGGVLLLYRYDWNSGHGDVDVVYRYHDDEDNNNKNHVENLGGQILEPNSYLGECQFGRNTGLTWRFSDKARSYALPFKYGVLSNEFSGSNASIDIDDENGSNSNWSHIFRHRAGSNTTDDRMQTKDERFRGILTTERNTSYYIKTYN